jgi:hypothetical protein
MSQWRLSSAAKAATMRGVNRSGKPLRHPKTALRFDPSSNLLPMLERIHTRTQGAALVEVRTYDWTNRTFYYVVDPIR